jgi:hypothetical protein
VKSLSYPSRYPPPFMGELPYRPNPPLWAQRASLHLPKFLIKRGIFLFSEREEEKGVFFIFSEERGGRHWLPPPTSYLKRGFIGRERAQVPTDPLRRGIGYAEVGDVPPPPTFPPPIHRKVTGGGNPPPSMMGTAPPRHRVNRGGEEPPPRGGTAEGRTPEVFTTRRSVLRSLKCLRLLRRRRKHSYG